MTKPSDGIGELHRILSDRFRAPVAGELHDDLDLGPSGFGLDSISLIELLIACEDYFGVPFPFTLFDAGPLTVGKLVGHAAQSRQRTRDA